MANLSLGSSGDEVKKLQTSLINAGYDVGSTGADGQYGAATQAAVQKYQTDNGINADGIAGDITLSKLYGNATSPTSPAPTAATVTTATPTAKAAFDPTKPYDAANDAAYQQAIATLQSVQKATPTYSATYDQQLNDLYNQIVNRDKFNYDLNADMLYQQYAQQYADMGKMAMMDTMGQAAGLTGGYGSTYGQAVGQQQYDAYLQRLNEVIPELYGQAYQRYQDEGDQMLQNYAMLGDLADQEYGRYEDEYNRWLTERNYAQGMADDAYKRGFNEWAANMDQYNIDREYQLALDKWNYQVEQERAAQAAAAAAAAAASSGGGGGGGGGGSRSTGNGTSNGGGSGNTYSVAAIPSYVQEEWKNADDKSQLYNKLVNDVASGSIAFVSGNGTKLTTAQTAAQIKQSLDGQKLTELWKSRGY